MYAISRTRLLHALAALAVLAAPLGHAADKAGHWEYKGAQGPAKWGELSNDFATCKIGKTQSPIDIRDQDVKPAKLEAIRFDYKPAPLKVVDNGHTIQVNLEPGSSISIGGKEYQLLQFHFHKPSEEKVNGKSYDMVAHLVHKDRDGKLAVVAVLMKKGKADPLIKTVWDNLPKEVNKESAPANVNIDVAKLLPENRAYYTFTGSLTTPPCSEGVTWFVLKNPVTVSDAQVARFHKAYALNARPVQPLNGRAIQASQ